jgi:cellobiose phosphorylase
MIYTAYQIVMEEGKTDFLFENVDYYDGGQGTVFEHLQKSIEFTLANLGTDGLPLMLDSDWNDMLSNVCKKGKGESVFVSQMLVLACKQMLELCGLLGEDTAFYEETIKAQEKILNDFCWDGEWFIRAVTDEGMKLGKKGDECAEIWINSQSWAVFSESTTKERGMSAMNAAMEKLDCGYGLMKLYPPLQRNYPSKENELTFAQPGIGENGGVFCHANTWAIIAQCMLGNSEQAYKIYKDMIPDNIVKKFGVDLYNAEPYIYSSNIRAPMALSAGSAGVSWLSGTAAWMTIAVQQYIFGLKPKMDGLEINPCIPKAWKLVKVQRVFRGCTYDITIENHDGGNMVKEIYVNGEKIDGNVVSPKGEKLQITVVLGV